MNFYVKSCNIEMRRFKGVGFVISKQVLQNTMDGIKAITGADLCLTDVEGCVLAATYDPETEVIDMVAGFIDSMADSQEIRGYRFFKVSEERMPEYVLIVSSDSETGHMVGKLAVFQIQGLLTAYKERFDRDNFVKNLILDNLLLIDIQNRAKKLHIKQERRRVVYVLEIPAERYNYALDAVRSLFTGQPKDFITSVDEKSIIIVRELEENEGYTEIRKTAKVILGLFPGERGEGIRISNGTVVGELREVSRSYKEARMALEVGKIFFQEKKHIAYSTLGIGRLIYQLPISLCEIFIKEIFGDEDPEDFDEETLETINEFFKNSLNVSETARKLFIHRNTLVYRLDKIHKSTGLDLRIFEDAITFKIAMMVVKYMKHIEMNEF